MKYILFVIIILISPFVTIALLSICAHLIQWMSKQLNKLNKYKAGKIFVKVVTAIASIIGLLIMLLLYSTEY